MVGIWPGNTRCVVSLTFDVDGVSGFINRVPDARKMPTLMSMGEYGPSIALPRILELLGQEDIRATFFTPGHVIDTHIPLMGKIVDRGHEVAHHGYMHEPPYTLSAREEMAVLVKGIKSIRKVTGSDPQGYRSPAWELSEHTLGYLGKLGFLYDSSLMNDDAPSLLNASGKRLIELPIHWVLDDAVYFSYVPMRNRVSPMLSPEAVFEVWKAEFDGIYKYGRYFNLTMHPYLIGRPGRLLMLEKMIAYIKSFTGVVFLKCYEVAELFNGNDH